MPEGDRNRLIGSGRSLGSGLRGTLGRSAHPQCAPRAPGMKVTAQLAQLSATTRPCKVRISGTSTASRATPTPAMAIASALTGVHPSFDWRSGVKLESGALVIPGRRAGALAATTAAARSSGGMSGQTQAPPAVRGGHQRNSDPADRTARPVRPELSGAPPMSLISTLGARSVPPILTSVASASEAAYIRAASARNFLRLPGCGSSRHPCGRILYLPAMGERRTENVSHTA